MSSTPTTRLIERTMQQELDQTVLSPDTSPNVVDIADDDEDGDEDDGDGDGGDDDDTLEVDSTEWDVDSAVGGLSFVYALHAYTLVMKNTQRKQCF